MIKSQKGRKAERKEAFLIGRMHPRNPTDIPKNMRSKPWSFFAPLF